MTALLSMVIAALLYIFYQYYSYQLALEEDSVEYRKSNLVSSFIYLIAVLLLIYRFDRQLWKSKSVPVRLMFDIISVFVTLELLVNIAWDRIEYIVLVKLPSVVNNVLEAWGSSYRVGGEIFVPLLYAISFTFLVYAHNSDRYLDYFLEDEEEMSPSVSESGLSDVEGPAPGHCGYGDALVTPGRAERPVRQQSITYRGPNTLPTTSMSLRRSGRHRANALVSITS